MSVNQMKQVLEAMIQCHDALYKMAEQKRDAIKAGNSEAVGNITEKETPLVETLSRLEAQREKVMGEDLGPGSEQASFSEWAAAILPEEKRDEWEKLYLELASRVYALKQANTLNQTLLRDSLLWVNLNLGLLKPQTHTLNNYHNPRVGQAPASVFSGRIDSRT